MHFIKMHGAGNDYVFCDGFTHDLPPNPSELARRISQRHFGIGSDGLVFLIPPQGSGPRHGLGIRSVADCEMQMWNADGSPGSMCGNAARCVAFWMKRQQRVASECRIQIGELLLVAQLVDVDAEAVRSAEVVLRMPPPANHGTMTIHGIPEVARLSKFLIGSDSDSSLLCERVDCGNQHAVIFVAAHSDELINTLGPLVENHSMFPDRVNVEFVCVRDRRTLDVQIWERGSGRTLACGSGACAAAVAAIARNRCAVGSEIRVQLPGGLLSVQWPISKLQNSQEFDPAELLLKGPVAFEFEGVWMGDPGRLSP